MTQGVVYILQCSNGEYYVGSTSDLENRLNEHEKGRGCDFTKAHLPVKLVYTEEYPTIEKPTNESVNSMDGVRQRKKLSFVAI